MLIRTYLVLATLITLLSLGCKVETRADEILSSQNKNPIEEYKLTSADLSLLDTLQKQTFNYFWEGAEPNSGLARERLHMDDDYPTSPKNTVTTGGSGFGFMALLVGIERGYITRKEALARYQKMLRFLETADRFHGAWPHWLNGETGKVLPFSKKDNGGDLVETAFLIEGMLTVAEYFRDGTEEEQALTQNIERLWRGVEWDWYTNGKNVLYWHWSPEYNWEMNFPVGGYNECLIMYILAAASPTHSIKKEVYEKGWARDGRIVSKDSLYGNALIFDYYEHDTSAIGPLFWAHYSYLGLNPTGLSDQYANYWDLVKNQARIHYRYAQENPEDFKFYGDSLWGLTSSYSIKGYAGHRPGNDLGVISPTAALSSFPYTPKESMQMISNLYKNHDSLIGKYGPYDAFSFTESWYTPRYLAIDQGPIPVMIENYRTGLLWKLFMKNNDVKSGLDKLGFRYQH